MTPTPTPTPPPTILALFALVQALGVSSATLARRLHVSKGLITLWRQGHKAVTPDRHRAFHALVRTLVLEWRDDPSRPKTPQEVLQMRHGVQQVETTHREAAQTALAALASAQQALTPAPVWPPPGGAPESFAALQAATHQAVALLTSAEYIAMHHVGLRLPADVFAALRSPAAQKETDDAQAHAGGECAGESHPLAPDV